MQPAWRVVQGSRALMVVFETRLIEAIERAPKVKSFRFKPDRDLVFKPGQFFFVSIMIDGKEHTKHFSFSNSPTEEGYIEFTKRLTGSDFSNALDRLGPEDYVKVKAPYGDFTFTGEHEKIAFLSGGIGITPIRSITKFVVDKGLPTDIALLYGNDREPDIIFRQDFDAMAGEKSNFKLVYTLTANDIDKQVWHGRLGYIDAGMIREELPDYKERVFFICGPPAMVNTLTGTLGNLGVAGERIAKENFTGY